MAIYVAFNVPDVHGDLPPVMHCSHMGPHLRDPVLMGTFFSFWVHISVPRSPFLVSPDALEVIAVTHSLTLLLSVSTDFTDVTLVSDDTY